MSRRLGLVRDNTRRGRWMFCLGLLCTLPLVLRNEPCQVVAIEATSCGHFIMAEARCARPAV